MQSTPSYAVLITDDAPVGTTAGAIAEHEEGAAVAGTIEEARVERDAVLNMMDWPDDAVEIVAVEFSPVESDNAETKGVVD